MYHYVRELAYTRYPKIRGLLISQFIDQLDYLSANQYIFFSIKQIMETLHGGGRLPPKSVLLSFDDGYIDHYTNVFPILNARKIPAFFSMPGKVIREKKLLDVNRIHLILASTPIKKLLPLVYERLDYYRGNEYSYPSNEKLYQRLAKPDRFDSAEIIFVKSLLQTELEESLRRHILEDLFKECIAVSEECLVRELYLTKEQVELMARNGMEWGIHGYSHYWMNMLSESDLRDDLTQALDVFDNVLDSKNWVCCYPHGAFNTNVLRCIQEYGATMGLTVEVRQADLSTDNKFLLPRWDTNDFPPVSMNFCATKIM
jgi:peptidoglycan/xylan/chitin deacetylase (PgdA/CDA1 family)